jgi:hypothetical protein
MDHAGALVGEEERVKDRKGKGKKKIGCAVM